MHKFLAAFLGILAFLIVCLYWLWQMISGEPALPLEDVALRAVVAMLAVWLLGRFLGRLGVAVMSEAWHESRARERDKSTGRVSFSGGRPPAAPKETGSGRTL